MHEPRSDHPNIVLTGFMGTGKSTAGRKLAERLEMEFVDTDTVIEARHGPIADIFRNQGESVFRAIERDLARELAGRRGVVIATGGRMMLDPDNVARLGRTGRVFCLVATPDEILRRVTNDASRVERPLLAVDDPSRKIVELLDERATGYGRFHQVATSGRSIDDVVDELVELSTSDA